MLCCSSACLRVLPLRTTYLMVLKSNLLCFLSQVLCHCCPLRAAAAKLGHLARSAALIKSRQDLTGFCGHLLESKLRNQGAELDLNVLKVRNILVLQGLTVFNSNSLEDNFL